MSDEPRVIIVRPGRPGRLLVSVPYSPLRLAKIKGVPGRSWEPALRCWTVPDEPGMVERLAALFAGDTIDAPGAAKGPLERLSEALRARHLSADTERTYTA